MNNHFYKQMIQDSPIGYAYHKILCDSDGKPCDYEFIEINFAFEKYTGLRSSDIIGKKISEIMPHIRNEKFDWIKLYGNIAINGGKEEFEQYSEALDRWYVINTYSPEKYYFITLFTDVTKEFNDSLETKTLFAALNDVVFQLDENFVFTNVITPDESILFMPREAIIGKSVKEIFTGKLSELFTGALRKALISNKTEFIIYKSPVPGDSKWFKASIKYVDSIRSGNFAVLISNITEQKQLEDESLSYKNALEKHIRLQDLLFDISSDFVNVKTENIEATIQISLEKLGKIVGADRTHIFRYDFENKTFSNTFEWHDKNLKSRIQYLQDIDIELIPEWTEHHLKGKSFYVSDVSSLKYIYEIELLNLHGINSLLAVPIILENKPYGFVGFNSVNNHHFYGELEQHLLENFGQLLLTILLRKENEEEILKKTTELENFFSVNLDLLCITDIKGTLIRVNKAWESILGYSPEYLKGRSFLEFIHPDDISSTLDSISRLKNQEAIYHFVNRYKCADGSYRFIEWHSQPYANLIYVAARDITERKNMEDSLFIEKEKFQATLFSIGDGVVSVDKNQKVVLFNKIAEQLTGWSESEAIGKDFEIIFNMVDEDSHKKSENPILKVIETGNVIGISNNLKIISRNGSEIAIEYSASPIKDINNDIQGVVLVLRNVTEIRKIQKQIEYFSFYDYLTGLYNRRFFEEELIRLDVNRNLPISIIMLDVNGLKMTNDAFGHEIGDALLQKVAEILKMSCRADDVIARLGGDEFAIILPKSDELQADIIATRIADATLNETISSVMISVASGYSTKLYQNQDINEIIKASEICMYKNKIKSGKLMRKKTFELIISTLNKNYNNEQAHASAVSKLCKQIGFALGLSAEQLENLGTVAVLHDIGKITIPPAVLNKKEPLTQEESDLIERHSESGYQIMKSVEEYSFLAQYVLSHHERWDGNGYPRKQKGKDIPLFSRIISVADAYDAMTNERPYKNKLSKNAAILELRKNSGTQFDPEIVSVFIEKVLLKQSDLDK